MKVLKKLWATAALALTLFGSDAAHAGIPVVDVANLAQSIMQVLAWVQQYGQMAQQYEQMVQQYQQQVQQYQALTGSRNLGDILNNPALQQAVPSGAELASTYNAINANGISGLSNAARQLRSSTMLYNCEGRTGDDLRACQAFLNNTSQTLANAQSTLDSMAQRVQQIQGLQSRINGTNDPKAIAELTARLAAEQAQVSNDGNRVALMQLIASATDRAAQQQIKERELKLLTTTSTTADTFVYVPH